LPLPSPERVTGVTLRLDRMVDTLAETVEGPPPVRGARLAVHPAQVHARED
jgi:hypothetical protein